MEQVGFCKVAIISIVSSLDYEFLNSDTNELKSYLNSAKKAISKLRETGYLYFKEYNDGCFVEVITERKFKPIFLEDRDVPLYYNKESGLYLLPKVMYVASKKESLSVMNDKEYIKNVNNFFDTFTKIEEKDTELVSKSQYMLLLQNKKIVE